MKKIFTLAIGCLMFSACYYDNTSELYPAAGLNNNCDTISTITYNNHIKPLYNTYCGTNGSCHSTSVANGGVILDNYANASSVNDTKLIGCIEQQQGYSVMPPTGKMSDCGITQIKKWIQEGKPE